MERLVAIGLGVVIMGGLIVLSIFEHNHSSKLQTDLVGLLQKHQATTNELTVLRAELHNLTNSFLDLQKIHQSATNELAQMRAQPGTNGELPIYSQVPDFTLTNQLSEAVTAKQLRGKIWLADIIFTRCAGPCPIMTRTMADLQMEIPADWPIRFVTLTTDPEFDTPEVLRKYAGQFGGNSPRWEFLTGTKKEIARLAVDGLKMTAIPKAPADRQDPNDLFIHATIFVLVDAQGRVRATFESDDDNLVQKVKAAIAKLRAEDGP